MCRWDLTRDLTRLCSYRPLQQVCFLVAYAPECCHTGQHNANRVNNFEPNSRLVSLRRIDDVECMYEILHWMDASWHSRLTDHGQFGFRILAMLSLVTYSLVALREDKGPHDLSASHLSSNMAGLSRSIDFYPLPRKLLHPLYYAFISLPCACARCSPGTSTGTTPAIANPENIRRWHWNRPWRMRRIPLNTIRLIDKDASMTFCTAKNYKCSARDADYAGDG